MTEPAQRPELAAGACPQRRHVGEHQGIDGVGGVELEQV
jgi:hypothetical protein